MNIVLSLSYVGSHFYGWQKQAGELPTIQTTVEKAIAKIANHPVKLVVSGRTDTGVHALGQIVNFHTESLRDMRSWVHGVNSFLPEDITIESAQIAPDEFHARFDAYRRDYRYVLYNCPIKPSIHNRRVGWTYLPLDIAKMNQAAQLLLGQQDFSSFRSSECQAHSPVKLMYHTEVYQSNGIICFDFAASAFLHHMVRNIVGALVYVGSGRINIADFQAIIEEKSRLKAPPTFSADGLYLTRVEYPQKFALIFPPVPKWFWGKAYE